MKLLLVSTLSLTLLAADKAKEPKPLTPEQQVTAYQQTVSLQQEQIQYLKAQVTLLQNQINMAGEQSKLESIISGLRSKDDPAGCDLDIKNMKWVCPPTPAPAPVKKEEDKKAK